MWLEGDLVVFELRQLSHSIDRIRIPRVCQLSVHSKIVSFSIFYLWFREMSCFIAANPGTLCTQDYTLSRTHRRVVQEAK